MLEELGRQHLSYSSHLSLASASARLERDSEAGERFVAIFDGQRLAEELKISAAPGQAAFSIEPPVPKADVAHRVAASPGAPTEDVVEVGVEARRAMDPAEDFGGAMPVVLPLAVRPVLLMTDVGHPLIVQRAQLGPILCARNVPVGHAPLDIDYVEYAAVDCVRTGQRDGCAYTEFTWSLSYAHRRPCLRCSDRAQQSFVKQLPAVNRPVLVAS